MRHMRVHREKKHSRTKTFNCDVCEYAFTTEWSLKRHTRIHDRGNKSPAPVEY